MIFGKGQISIYIILSIAILLITGIVGYLYFNTSKLQMNVPQDARPVYDFVTSCVSQTAKQGITRMGVQGGFINVPPIIARTPKSRIALDNYGLFSIPLWYYNGEDRTPSIEYMQSELSKNILSNLNQCIDSFSSFKDVSVIPLEEPKLNILFTDNSVVANLKWQLQIKKASQILYHDTFVSELDVKIKKAWELADAFLKKENKENLFEKMTVDLMSADSQIPITGMEFSCQKKKWSIKGIKERLHQILNYNIPIIRIKNTPSIPFEQSNYVYNNLARSREKIMTQFEQSKNLIDFDSVKDKPSNAPQDAYDYFHLNFDIGKNYELKTGFLYSSDFGMDITAKPNNGGNMESNLVKGARKFIKFFCVNQWHFAYDIIYPVVMIVKDDSAFDKQGFVFQMAFPVMINANEGQRTLFSHRNFESIDYDTEYCRTKSNRIVEFKAKGLEEQLPFATELKDAQITFACGMQECNLGNTTANEGTYKLIADLPEGCANPLITASKQGYISKEAVLTDESSLDISLTKLKTMKVEVVKHTYSKYLDQLSAIPEFLNQNEQARILMSLKEEPYDTALEYEPSKQSIIQIADKTYTYNIDASLLYGDELRGGYYFEDIPLNYDDFADKDTIILHLLTMSPLPADKDEMAELMNLARSKRFKEQLKPTFR